ncbi:hypothetical protein QJS04_geneDACA018780 [Acorus gramineus]|uniref:RRM domain-containing protein n=1 Tax=Acorus gramineus TaxID=55184 RepID=A0AAV9BSI1_ACOGR|nr:hypothetical protein QJS04_geneDACA018780 [Acorus gramineus]
MDPCYLRMGLDPQLTVSHNWTIDVRDIRTVKVSNISLAATEKDIKEFFSFSGDIEYVEMQKESEISQLAYVTFKESQGAETATLLSGATIIDLSVNIMPVENYHLPAAAFKSTKVGHPPVSRLRTRTYVIELTLQKCIEALFLETGIVVGAEEVKLSGGAEAAVKKAEDVVSSMLAKGFVLGKDALNKAKAFDERLHLIGNASATVVSLDRRIGLSEKISLGTAAVNGKVREVDEMFQVSDRTRSALIAAEQKACNAGSVLLSMPYVSTGASWVSSAISMVAKAAGDVGSKTREKVDKAEEEKKEIISEERRGMVREFAQIHLDEGEPPMLSMDAGAEDQLGII